MRGASRVGAVGLFLLSLMATRTVRAVDPPTPLGPEFQVNTYTTESQDQPAIASDAAGNFVIVWHSCQYGFSFGPYYCYPNHAGIFGQRYDSAGAPVGSEFQVNSYTKYDQRNPSVAMDPAGSFVVVWQSGTYYGPNQDGSGYGVFGQRFDSMGLPVGTEFQVNTYTTFDQRLPDVGMDGSGNFVVVWESGFYSGGSQDGSGTGIFGQRFDSGGAMAGTEFQVNTYTTNPQRRPAIGMNLDGDFIVVWESASQDGDDDGIFGQRYDSSGNAAGTEFQVNTYTTDEQDDVDVAMDPSGSFVVVWESPQDDSGTAIIGRQFDSSGNPLGAEFQVNTYTTGDQEDPAVATDPAGNFIIVWEHDGNSPDGNRDGVFGRRYDSSGQALTSEFQVNTYTTNIQDEAAITIDPSGNFVVAWESLRQDGSAYGVFAQRFQGCLMDSDCPSDGNVCTDEECQQGNCVSVNNTDPCDDGDVCTLVDMCAGGTCVGGSIDPCNDSNVCTNDSCTAFVGCSNVPNANPCDDGLFCNGADMCGGGTCSVHVGDPCTAGGQCNDICNETADNCISPDCTMCDDSNGATHNDRCHNGVCFGNTGPLSLGAAVAAYSVLGVDSTSVTATASSNGAIAGHVCALRAVMGSNTTVGGKLIATRTSGNAANFAGGNTVASGIFTGGGTVSPGNPAVVSPGGTFIAPANKAVNQVNQCMTAANRVAAAAAVIGDPTVACPTDAFPTNVVVANNGSQTLNVTPGMLNVIQLQDLDVGMNGQLVIKSGMANNATGVVINVTGLFRVRRGGRIKAGAGVKPEQILINVANTGGTATLERDSRMAATLIAVDREIGAGMGVITDGGLFGGVTAIGIGPSASIGNKSYKGPLP